MRAYELVNESLTSPVDYASIPQSPNRTHLNRYEFAIDNANYEVRFLKRDLPGKEADSKEYEVDFSVSLPNAPYAARNFGIVNLGQQQLVFSTVIKILRDFIEKFQPDSIMFSADKSETSRVRLYQALLRRFRPELEKMGYEANLGGGSNTFADFYITRKHDNQTPIQENKFDFAAGDCPIFAIALHKLSGLPLYGLVEYIEDIDDWALIHAYVKTKNGKAIDINGITTVESILDTYPREGYEDPQEVKFTEQKLLKIGYGKNKCPTLDQVLPHAKKVLDNIGHITRKHDNQKPIQENIDPTEQDLKDVAHWMNTTPDKLSINIKQEPIKKFMSQIREMYSTYNEFPNDEERTNRILKMLKRGMKPLPVYVEANDPHLFVMEGRHRMVAFYLAGLKMIPVAYVSVKTKKSNQQGS